MDSSSSSKRRRGLGVVTPNACTECRKKRAKCDGQRPCGRCASQQIVECIYEVPVRQSKEDMRSEIEDLRIYQKQADQVLAALISSDRSSDILEQLRFGEPMESVASRLIQEEDAKNLSSAENITPYARMSDHQAGGSTLKLARSTGSTSDPELPTNETYISPLQSRLDPNLSPWHQYRLDSLPQPPERSMATDMMNWTPGIIPSPQINTGYDFSAVPLGNAPGHPSDKDTIQLSRNAGQEAILGQDFGIYGLHEPHQHVYNEVWTTISTDGAFVEHLMALYFCWEYPTFASLSKEHFLEDFRTGRRRHCSSLLVNAMLALGCRFSEQPSARSVPDDANTAGDHFFAEAMRLLQMEKERHILTTIQALGLMSIREASAGRSSVSIFLSGQSIRLAIEMGLHQDAQFENSEIGDIERAVRSATFWGAFSLDQAWSLSIGKLPHFSRVTKLAEKPAIVEHIEASSWVPYTDDGAPLEKDCTQLSNVRSVYKTFCELSEIVHETLYELYTPGIKVTSRTLLESYTKYLRWYDSIPTALRLGYNFTPAVLFAHMYYHFAILLLFRPFIHLSIIGSSVAPRDVCGQAAEAISALVNSYSQLYTLQRTPSLVPYVVLASSISHLVELGQATSPQDHLHQGIWDLEAMTICHGFATQALDIIRFLAHRWGVKVPTEILASGNPEEICRPSIIGQDQSTDSTSALFWPFPLQGRPMLGMGALLEASGFEILSQEVGKEESFPFMTKNI